MGDAKIRLLLRESRLCHGRAWAGDGALDKQILISNILCFITINLQARGNNNNNNNYNNIEDNVYGAVIMT